MNGVKMEVDDSYHSTSAGANGSGLMCCLIDNGQRCKQLTGNASYSKRIAKMVQQRRLKLTLDHSAKHIYICDDHKNTIQHMRSQQKSRDSPRGGEFQGTSSSTSKTVHSEINFFVLPVNLLRRYKRHFKLPSRPGTNKTQLADAVARHFVKIPVNEKEILTYFLYMCKNNKNRLDNNGSFSAGGGGAESSN